MNSSWTVRQEGSITSPFVRMNTSTTTPLDATPFNEWEPFTLQQLQDAHLFSFIVYPILLVCCSLGNTITLVVLCKTSKKGSTNAYMTTVAVADLFVLWMYFPRWLWDIGLKNDPNFMVPYDNFNGLQAWGQNTFGYLSDWTLIAFSLERLLAITKPLTFGRLHSAKYARIISVVLLFLSGAATFYFVFNWYYYGYYTEGESSTSVVNVAGRNTDAFREWGRIHFTSEVCILLGTCLLLLLINAGVVLVILAMSKGQSLGKKSGDPKSRIKQHRNSILVLLGSVALYLVSQLPSAIFAILLIATNYKVYSMRRGSQIMGPIFLSQIQQINYTFNFLVYATCGNHFRLQFLEVFGKTRLMRYFVHRKTNKIQVANLEEIGARNLTMPRNSSNGSISSYKSSQSCVLEMELTHSNGNASGGFADKAMTSEAQDTTIVEETVTKNSTTDQSEVWRRVAAEVGSAALLTKAGISAADGVVSETKI